MSNHFVEEPSIIISAADLAITDALLGSIAEEMGEALGRTAYSCLLYTSDAADE